VSPDSPKKHRKFKEKHALPYPLLSDQDHSVAEQYGVWTKLLFWGRVYWGVSRTTFVIDARGRVAKVFEKVQAEGHGAEVADYVAANREALARR
jgi:peroxiredoxin Q/BCP